MQYDVIIIGAGISGLVAGAKIAKEGKKVLLLEQNATPGGCATTFKRGKYTIEAGLHMMYGNPIDSKQEKILKELNVFDNVEFLKIPEFYRFINERVDITIETDANKNIKNLIKKFPNEKKGIKKIFKTITSLRVQMFKYPQKKWQQILLLPFIPILLPNLFFNKNKNLGEILDKYLKNEDLKLAILANIVYYHNDPRSMSFLWFSAAQAGYMKNGAVYIKGGSKKLADHFAKEIIRNGGDVKYRSLVTKILVKGNKATGVQYKDLTNKKQPDHKIYANSIIANTAIPNVIKYLPKKSSKKLIEKTNFMEYAVSLFTVYIGFNKLPKEFGCNNFSVFIYNKNIHNQDDVFRNNIGEISERSFCFVDYSQVDSQLAPKNKALGVIVCADNISDWENLSKNDYEKKKEKTAKAFIDRLNLTFPGIKSSIDFFEVSTPKTIERWTLNSGGTPYGFAQTINQAGSKRLGAKSSISNLYFASAWVTPGGGVTPAIFSGYIAGTKVLKNLK